ncbi:MAG: hypothetical protein KF819_33490 [Labilithrix sp.]|nr:hypothetical protein [Labilithrix sp.]
MRAWRSLTVFAAALGVGACAAILGIDDRSPDDAGPTAEGGPPGADTGTEDAADAGLDDAQSGDPDADAAPLPVYMCNGAPVTTCAGCAAGTAVCPATNTCVASCLTECAPTTIGCYSCAGGQATGICELPTLDASCIANPAYLHCPCVGNSAATCPGPNQVCISDECRTCGEPMTLDQVCRDGTGQKKCKPVTEGDVTRRLQCK